MRIFSAIQPSGQLHIGNYFGSIKPNLDAVKDSEQSFYYIVDLHALTTVQDPEVMRRNRIECALDILACGLDPDRTVFCFQSQVPEHTELAWILSTVTPMGLLERAVSFKEKVERGIAASAGLFNYPVLMAADILVYKADIVPVGQDQRQHLEITRDIAVKFNNVFGEIFVIPAARILKDVAVVPGTDGQKMSKSYGNTIPIFGEEATIKKAVMGIQTDSKGAADPKDPDTCVLFQIHKLFLSPAEAKALAAEYRNGLPYGEGKKRLLATIMDFFGAARNRRATLEKNPSQVLDILSQGSQKAKSIASGTMAEVRKAVGLL